MEQPECLSTMLDQLIKDRDVITFPQVVSNAHTLAMSWAMKGRLEHSKGRLPLKVLQKALGAIQKDPSYTFLTVTGLADMIKCNPIKLIRAAAFTTSDKVFDDLGDPSDEDYEEAAHSVLMHEMKETLGLS